MHARGKQNFNQMLHIAQRLQSLREKFVFVGGSSVILLITDPLAPDLRPTVDVDVIVDVISLSNYHSIEKQLRDLNFTQEMNSDSPICSWKIDNIRLDVVPTDKKILGFSNPWYKDAIKDTNKVQLNSEITINMISAPYFLATKLAAFNDRGNNDVYSSHDLEDIITVIDGRSELIQELKESKEDLKLFIKSEFQLLLNHPDFVNALPGHIIETSDVNLRLPIVKKRLNDILDLK